MARTITVAGGNLYQLALQYLNDATQFNRIVAANSAASEPIDPFITGLVTLKIPSVNSQLTGGILVG